MNQETDMYPDVCVCCGKPVPEGRMVCHACELETTAPAPREPEPFFNKIKMILGSKKEKKNDQRR